MQVFIISNEPWGDIWYSKHQYAHALSRMGYSVLFIDPVKKWEFADLFSFKPKVLQIQENLQVVQYRNNFPMRVWPGLFLWLNDRLALWKLRSHIPRTGTTIWWQFDIFRFIRGPESPHVKKIYHIADPYMHHAHDEMLARRSDLVVCTSTKYVDYYQKRFPLKPVMHIPHGISISDSNADEAKRQAWKHQFGRFALLAGSINDTIDLSLLARLTEANISVVVAGIFNASKRSQKKKWQELTKSSKFYYVGVVHAQELKHLIAAATVCITAYSFSLRKAIGSGSPLKILHYLAQQKPVVSTIDPEIDLLLNNAIYRANDGEQYISLVAAGMDGRLEVDKTAVEDYLQAHRYPVLIKKILARVE